jgi:hypothetical protein
MYSFGDTAKERHFMEGYKQAAEDLLNELQHKSDCGVHNEPAFPNTGCDCGLWLNSDELHNIVMDYYDADPLEAASGAAERAMLEQFHRTKSSILEILTQGLK